jgi:uncharacterized sulfatase
MHKAFLFRRRTAGAFTFAFALVCSAHLAHAATQPNIIILNIDDMGYADLAPYNTDGVQADTPTASRLASEGLRFTNYYVSSPICSASRAGLADGSVPEPLGH